MNVRYIVELEEAKRERLHTMVSPGTERARRLKRAQVLLAAERGESDAVITRTLAVGTSTVYRSQQSVANRVIGVSVIGPETRPAGVDEVERVGNTSTAELPSGGGFVRVRDHR